MLDIRTRGCVMADAKGSICLGTAMLALAIGVCHLGVLLWKWSISEIHKNISNNVYSFSPYKLDGHWGINVYFLQSNGPSYSSRWTSTCEFPACFSFPSRSSWPSSSDHGKGKNLRWRDGQCVSGLISTAVAVRLSSIADLLFDCFILVLKSNQITLGGWEGRQTLTR